MTQTERDRRLPKGVRSPGVGGMLSFPRMVWTHGSYRVRLNFIDESHIRATNTATMWRVGVASYQCAYGVIVIDVEPNTFTGKARVIFFNE